MSTGIVAAGAAPLLENRDPVHLRQADVEDDGVIGLGVAEEVAFLAIVGAVDRVACLLERRAPAGG